MDDFEREAELRRPDAATAEAVEALLALPFEDALTSSEALRHYIEEDEDAEEIRSNFAKHWGLDAPTELREVLEHLVGAQVANPVVDALLQMPFEQVLTSFPQIQRYIDEDETDPAELRDNFSRHWGPLAPPALRQALGKLLHGDTDAAATAATAVPTPAGLLALPLDIALRVFPALERHIELPGGEASAELHRQFREHWGPTAPAELWEVLEDLINERAGRTTSDSQGLHEEDAQASETDVQTAMAVNTLLDQSFDVARKSPALQTYFASQDDQVAVEAAFRENWGPEASQELRQVLRRILVEDTYAPEPRRSRL